MEDTHQIICPSCTRSCPEDAHFCPNCRSPISSYASTGPFESIFSEGAVYRSAVSSPTKLIIVIGVWLIFLPFLCLGIFSLVLLTGQLREAGFSEMPADQLYLMVIGLATGPIGAYAIYRTTRTYLAARRGQTGP